MTRLPLNRHPQARCGPPGRGTGRADAAGDRGLDRMGAQTRKEDPARPPPPQPPAASPLGCPHTHGLCEPEPYHPRSRHSNSRLTQLPARQTPGTRFPCLDTASHRLSFLLPTVQSGIASHRQERERQFVSPGRQPVLPTALSQTGSRQQSQPNGPGCAGRDDHLVSEWRVRAGARWAGAGWAEPTSHGRAGASAQHTAVLSCLTSHRGSRWTKRGH